MTETEMNTGKVPGDAEMNAENTEQQLTGNQTDPAGIEKEKTFTQEEVDKIVEKRLNRERKKFSSLLNGNDPREAELEERERAITEKELRLEALEVFTKEQLPEDMLDLLNYTDKESCEKSIELVRRTFSLNVQAEVNRRLRGDAPMRKAPEPESADEAVRNAFGL